jgi:hypothetical protein
MLTPTICHRTKPEATKNVLWDAGILGLCLVITPAGVRTILVTTGFFYAISP